jgi:hypothetical protein
VELLAAIERASSRPLQQFMVINGNYVSLIRAM